MQKLIKVSAFVTDFTTVVIKYSYQIYIEMHIMCIRYMYAFVFDNLLSRILVISNFPNLVRKKLSRFAPGGQRPTPRARFDILNTLTREK